MTEAVSDSDTVTVHSSEKLWPDLVGHPPIDTSLSRLINSREMLSENGEEFGKDFNAQKENYYF